MSLRHVYRAALAALGLVVLPPIVSAAPLDTFSGGAPIVIGHQGASGYLPAHTLAVYELAIRWASTTSSWICR